MSDVTVKPAKHMKIMVPADVHKQLKLASVMAETTMAEHVITILREVLVGEEKLSDKLSEM